MVQSFDNALFYVADLLTDAHTLEQRGSARRAETVYTLAETYALRTGYLELLKLVWSSTPPRRRHAPVLK